MDGTGKMGKSAGNKNAVFLADPPEVISKKVMRAMTDGGPTQMNEKMPEAIQNLFAIMEAVSSKDTLSNFKDAYNNCTIRYGDLKKQLAQDIISFTTPIRERIEEISADESYLKKVLKEGAEKARESGGMPD